MPANWQRGSLATMSSLQCNATLGTQLIKMQMQMQEDGAKTKGCATASAPATASAGVAAVVGAVTAKSLLAGKRETQLRSTLARALSASSQ